MKFFTREWANGVLSESESDAAVSRYQEHVERLLPELPGDVALLATSLNLHDGLILRAVVDHRDKTLRLDLLCGDRQRGYVCHSLTYRSVADADFASLARVARDRRTELNSSEVDKADASLFEHRMLFVPDGELLVRFGALEIATTARQERSLPFVGDPYRETDGD